MSTPDDDVDELREIGGALREIHRKWGDVVIEREGTGRTVVVVRWKMTDGTGLVFKVARLSLIEALEEASRALEKWLSRNE